MRRAVSTAYYAVSHLLIAESTANWSRLDLQTALGRAFDHATMKAASKALANAGDFRFAGEDLHTVAALRYVCSTFAELREQRHFADYNLSRDLDSADARQQVDSAESLFSTWRSIRHERISQEYLVSLLVRHRG